MTTTTCGHEHHHHPAPTLNPELTPYHLRRSSDPKKWTQAYKRTYKRYRSLRASPDSALNKECLKSLIKSRFSQGSPRKSSKHWSTPKFQQGARRAGMRSPSRSRRCPSSLPRRESSRCASRPPLKLVPQFDVAGYDSVSVKRPPGRDAHARRRVRSRAGTNALLDRHATVATDQKKIALSPTATGPTSPLPARSRTSPR